jgi:hypothetical protein
MTIGFAATFFEKTEAGFLIAADSRYSIDAQSADIAPKTYALGRKVGAVAAGSALSVGAAAEITRGIAEDHDRLSPQAPINFYSTVRLFAFCLDRVESENPWTPGSEVVLAGFLANGSPALAKILTRKGARTEAYCYAPKRRGSLIAMVGQQDAKEQLAATVSRAFKEGRQHWAQWLGRAAATIWYLAKHEGVPSIGGTPSVAVCSPREDIFWPLVVIGGRKYLRGIDVTESVRDSNVEGTLHIRYEEAWHSETDQQRTVPEVRVDEGFLSLSRFVDEWVSAREIFDWKVDPDALSVKPDANADPDVVLIFRRGEVSWV